MNLFVNAFEKVTGWNVSEGVDWGISEDVEPETAGVKPDQKDTYEKAPEESSWWEPLICYLGRGIWRDGTCDYTNTTANWRR